MNRDDARQSQRPIAPDVLEQAADWLLRLSERTASAEDLAACERWRRLDPEHDRAWARAEHLHGLLASVPAAIARPVLDRPVRITRRTAIKHLGACMLLAPGAWLAWQLWDQTARDFSLHTAIGERRSERLPDGSDLQLDTNTKLDIAFSSSQRLLRLRRGQILINTATDPQQPSRPFRVATAHGRMQALGTRFNVRVEADRTWLAVLEGKVLVEPVSHVQQARRIDAGQLIWFDARDYGPTQHSDDSNVAWSRGMFAADALPLRQLLNELSRYRRGLLHCDPELAMLPVSGAFPLDDTDRSLAMLAATYPISIQRRASGWWTHVVKRPQ